MKTLFSRLRRHAVASGAQETRGVLSRPTGGPDTHAIQKALYAYDRKTQPARGGEEHIHASSFVHNPKCARALCLARMLRREGMPFEKRPRGSDLLLWRFGRAAESHVREALLSDPDIKSRVYALWSCRCQKVRVKGRLPASPAVCDSCGTPADRFHEPPMYDPETHIIGNPDFPIWENDGYTIYEVKSIKGGDEPNAFGSLTVPLPTHVEQPCHYIRLFEVAGLPVHRKPAVIYVNKQYSFREWYKVLEPTDLQVQQAEADVRAAVESTAPYIDYVRRLDETDPSGWNDLTLPERIEPCRANIESHRDKCPCWIECTAHP